MTNSALRLVAPTEVFRTVAPTRRPNAELRTREHLTPGEIKTLIEVAKDNRGGHWDATMILVAFRHGLRAAEVSDLRWDQVDFNGAVLPCAGSKTALRASSSASAARPSRPPALLG